MTARIYSEFRETKLPKASKARASHPGAGKGERWSGKETPSGYKNAGPAWKSSFNRATKADVVKTRPTKAGID